MAEKAQFTGVNEHFEAIFNAVSSLLGSYEIAFSIHWNPSNLYVSNGLIGAHCYILS